MIAPATATTDGWEALIAPQRLAGARKRLGRLVASPHRRMYRRPLSRTVLEHVAGLPLVVLPGVLHPRLMRTGAFFASALRAMPLRADATVLDLGTGSGVCALAAAQRARRIVAVDLSRSAVRCATINALLNGLEDRIEVLHGDLFGPVAKQRFDLVLFNPPFLRGEPRDEPDLAWRSLDVPERFAAGLADHLTPCGSALLLLSTFGDASAFLRPLARQGFSISLRARRSYFNERLSLLEIRPSTGPRAARATTDTA